MATEEDLFDDSDDSSDEDYVIKAEDNLPSEEEDEGEPEDDVVEDENIGKSGRKRKSNKKKESTRKKRSRKGQPLSVMPTKDDDSDDQGEEKQEVGEEDEKKKIDSLWSDFLKDTASPSLTKQATIESNSRGSKEKSAKIDCSNELKKGGKVTITKVFEFAGEKVEVTKEVPIDSLEAKSSSAKALAAVAEVNGGGSSEEPITPKGICKPKVGGGLSSLLSQIGKKSKIGTLEKSKIDWDRFKKSENLADDIEVHNRGRSGFLERQDFLQRTDLRQFEKEKQMRAPRRCNR